MAKRMMVVGMVLVVGFLFGPSNYSCAEEEGLVAYWNFDEGSGERAKDSSGNKNDGKIHGATYVKRGDGYALQFDGKDDYVDCGKGKALNFGTGDFSIQMWVNTPSPNIHEKMISKYFDDANRWYISTHKNLYSYFFGRKEGTDLAAISGATEISDGEWHQVVFVVHKGGTAYLYVDGVADGSAGAKAGDWDNGGNLYLGSLEPSCPHYYFRGTLDEVRIYNRTLTEEEIKSHYEIWWSNASGETISY